MRPWQTRHNLCLLTFRIGRRCRKSIIAKRRINSSIALKERGRLTGDLRHGIPRS